MTISIVVILSLLSTTFAVEGQQRQLLASNETDKDNADVSVESVAPVCADDEELFRLQLKADESWLVGGSPASYRVFTESSSSSETEVHAECIQCENYSPGADVQLCLPKNQCHTAVVGRSVGRWISCNQGGVEELVMTWGGEIIYANNAYLFASIDFGDGCLGTRCDDEESSFEFFLDGVYLFGALGPFSWELNRLSEVASETQTLHEGMTYKQISFIYERICVPQSSCLQFSMGYPSNWTKDFYDASPYSLRLDGVVYGEYELRMGLGLLSGRDKLNQTINLGGSCNAHTTCNPIEESLVELKFEGIAEEKCDNRDNNFTLSSAISTKDFPFWLSDENNNDYKDYYVWSASYNDFEIDMTYTFVGCIPKDRCVVLNVGSDNFPAAYKVYQDGVEMTKRVVHTGEESLYKDLTTTNLGDTDVCSSWLTPNSGLTLSISRGGVFVVAVIFTGFLKQTVLF